MFIKGKCAIYIDKNLWVCENSTGILVLLFLVALIQILLINLLDTQQLCYPPHIIKLVVLRT